jgi:hypothetical protein
MRKVESNMIAAVKARKDLRCGNTVVEQGDNGYAEIRLFGERIARLNYINGLIELSDCGYRTATTKSRLNAILHSFTNTGGGQGIYQQRFKWFWKGGQEWDGGAVALLLI